MATRTGTAQLLFGSADRARGGITPFLSLWLYEHDDHVAWAAEHVARDPVTWRPRSEDRALADALVLLVALTSTPRDPVPRALSALAGGLRWDIGQVDLSTWRHYDTALLDTLVAESEPAGKLVLSVLEGSSLGTSDLDVLDRLDWDLDVLTPRRSHRRADRDLHQAPPPRAGAPRVGPNDGPDALG